MEKQEAVAKKIVPMVSDSETMVSTTETENRILNLLMSARTTESVEGCIS